MGRRRRRNLVIGRGPSWLWTYTVGRGSIRMPVAFYLMYLAGLWMLLVGIPAAWEIGREIVTDIVREASLLFQ
jgi:hypothetical protein